jgi:hypothetical protein
MQAVRDGYLYVDHDIDTKSQDPEKVAIFIWETLPLCVSDIEERDLRTHVPVMGFGIKGERKLEPFTIDSMREPDRFHHAVHFALGGTQTFLHYVVGAPWTVPALRALGCRISSRKRRASFNSSP